MAAKKCGAKKTTHSHPPASLFSGAQDLQGLLSIRRKSAGAEEGHGKQQRPSMAKCFDVRERINVESDALLQYVPCGD